MLEVDTKVIVGTALLQNTLYFSFSAPRVFAAEDSSERISLWRNKDLQLILTLCTVVGIVVANYHRPLEVLW